MKKLTGWWRRDKMTNGQQLLLAVFGILAPLVLAWLGKQNVLKLLPGWAWLGIAVACAFFLLGNYAGRLSGHAEGQSSIQGKLNRGHDAMRQTTDRLRAQHARQIEGVREEERRLREQKEEMSEKYALHVRDALSNLERALSGEIPEARLEEFVGEGLFEPAQALLASEGSRGELRFSLLKPEGAEFVMTIALGHDMESRRAFRIPITGSFASLALQSGETKWSDNLEDDARYEAHPKARPGREYSSMVCVPLKSKGKTVAVLVVIATEREAFSVADRLYVETLASIHDVAYAIVSSQAAQDTDESREAS